MATINIRALLGRDLLPSEVDENMEVLGALANRVLVRNTNQVSTSDVVSGGATPTYANGVAVISGTITPVRANSKIRVRVVVAVYSLSTGNRQVAVFYGTGGNAHTLLKVVSQSGTGDYVTLLVFEDDIPVSSTDEITVEARVFQNVGGTLLANNMAPGTPARNEACTMELQECPQ